MEIMRISFEIFHEGGFMRTKKILDEWDIVRIKHRRCPIPSPATTHLGVIDIKLKIPKAGLKSFNIEPAVYVVYFDIF